MAIEKSLLQEGWNYGGRIRQRERMTARVAESASSVLSRPRGRAGDVVRDVGGAYHAPHIIFHRKYVTGVTGGGQVQYENTIVRGEGAEGGGSGRDTYRRKGRRTRR